MATQARGFAEPDALEIQEDALEQVGATDHMQQTFCDTPAYCASSLSPILSSPLQPRRADSVVSSLRWPRT